MRALVRRIPVAGRWCFVVAFVNVLVWTFLIPPFQVPDENSNFAYAQYVAETGQAPPERKVPEASPQETLTLEALAFPSLTGNPEQRGVMSALEEQQLSETLEHSNASSLGEGGASSASPQPPLYYTLEAIPYLLSPSSEILVRLELMRVLSALMAALTVLCIYMLLRELMPGTPWAWTVGALVVAFEPMFAFIGAGVVDDNLLNLACAATLLALAHAYRRGLTYRNGLAIGLATAVGLLAKVTMVALVPGVALAVLMLVLRSAGPERRQALLAGAAAVAAAAIPALIYVILNTAVWHRSAEGGGIFEASATPKGHAISLGESLSYSWQLFLPRLPFMSRQFTYYPLISTWLNGTIGRFGWLDYGFPQWVYEVAKWSFAALGLLACAAVVRLRAQLKPWLGLIGCYALMAAGLCVAIGYDGIRYRAGTGFVFEQARYLFPLIGLFACLLVLAARGLPGRWAPRLGAGLVLLSMTLGLFAQTLTISRYYG